MADRGRPYGMQDVFFVPVNDEIGPCRSRDLLLLVAARGLQARFDRIFSLRTGYGDLDKLLFRLGRRKDELLRVLERPETPLHTNASERDLRGLVIK
ncbi:hypothetical protein [Rhizobium leguminosarum]|uniref:hypothetical protein n=1 Tax=Rhizobium leguminosarum TaxID=384 RepID=UPI0028C4CD60|nr:hypothetical protein [Rhizobium leguminosarum]